MHKIILDWYDVNRRILPWRALPNETANAYHVYLSEILLQQTTVATVKDYFLNFIDRWPTLKDLAMADLEEILNTFQGLGYYTRAKNLHKSAKLLSELKAIPNDYKSLLLFPGIGEYTAKAVAAIAYNQPVVPVDGNVIRVFSRFFGVITPLPKLKKDIETLSITIGSGDRPSDFAQALMDFGSMVCKPQNPSCESCPLKESCYAFKHKIELPIKATKKIKPKKHGTAYIFYNNKNILIEKNASSGLLSNLWGVPTTSWEEKEIVLTKPFIVHVFTHIHLTLEIERIYIEDFSQHSLLQNQKVISLDDLSHYPLSTLMKKVLNAAL